MKVTAVLAAAVMVGILAHEKEEGFAAVPVCVQPGVTQEAPLAETIAGKMFAQIGVEIEWHPESACPAGLDAVIHILFVKGAPSTYFHGAYAFALPFEGIHIQVFIDRLRNSVDRRVLPSLLAHVLVHEIAHILQGTDHHSASGVMKAVWDEDDHAKMAWKPLGFTEEGAYRIHEGLRTWPERASRSRLRKENVAGIVGVQ